MALSKAAVPALVIRQEPDPEPAASNVVVIVKAKASLPLPQPVNGPGHQTGGYLLSDIQNATVRPVRPNAADDDEADPADLRYILGYMRSRKRELRWVCKEARDGKLTKRYRASDMSQTDYPDSVRFMWQVPKGCLTYMLEQFNAEMWPMEFWGNGTIVLPPQLLIIFTLYTGAGPFTSIPCAEKCQAYLIWKGVADQRELANTSPIKLPWDAPGWTGNVTVDDVKKLCEGQWFGRYCMGAFPGFPELANFQPNTVVMVCTLCRGLEGGPWFITLTDLDPAAMPEMHWEGIETAEATLNTPMGSFLVYQRFKAKYGAREVEAVMAPTPLNIRPMDHPQSVPECIAYRWVSQSMPKQLANTAEDRQRIARGGIAKHQPKTAKTGKYGKAKAKAGKAMMQLPAAMPNPNYNYGLMHLLNQAPQGPPPKAAAPAVVNPEVSESDDESGEPRLVPKAHAEPKAEVKATAAAKADVKAKAADNP